MMMMMIMDIMLDNANEYKYLAFTINKKGNFSPTLEDLSFKAKRAIYLISLILLYSSEQKMTNSGTKS